MRKLTPQADNRCFGCGAANPRGMMLEFESDEEQKRIVGRFRIPAAYQGGPGFLHGGIIALLLDEAMGKVSRFSGVRAVTAELNVEYKRRVPVETEIVVEAFQVEQNGRSLVYAGEIRDAGGRVLAKGRGRFVVVDREEYAKKLAKM
ncbi:MAG: PaaI family thioesterase [Candidatus Acidiferrales bacterium]